MRYRLKIISFLSVAGLLFSCHSSTDKVVSVSYKSDFGLDTVGHPELMTVEDDYASGTTVFHLKDRLLLGGPYSQYQLYSYPELRRLNKMITFPKNTWSSVLDQKLYSYNNGRFSIHKLDNRDSLVCDSVFSVSGIVPMDFQRIDRLNDQTYIFSDYGGDHASFYLLDLKNKTLTPKGRNLEDRSRFKNEEEYRSAYRHVIRVKPDQSAFVEAYCFCPRIRIYNSSCVLTYDIFLDNPPGNDKVVPVEYEKRYVFCDVINVTDHFIYILNRAQPLPYQSSNCNLLVLDWKGNLVARYRLDLFIYSFFVEGDDRSLFGTCWKEPEGFRFFRLKLSY